MGATPTYVSHVSHGPTYFSAKGACIYCGDAASRLTDEHIVPYSLGGQHVLRQASCRRCADITKRFEQKVARGLWGDARASFNAPTRRRKERPTKIAMQDPDELGVLQVPASEYPGGFVFYRMDKAGLLRGLPNTVDVSRTWKMEVVDSDARRSAFIEKHRRMPVISFQHVPEAFGQLLAKIGYCNTLSFLDVGDFRPICLPYILGTNSNPSFVVGGTPDQVAPEKDIGYKLETRAFGNNERLMLVALIRLYANMHTPAYHVVVGDVEGPAAVARVVGKLGPGSFAMLPKARNEHWMPDTVPFHYWYGDPLKGTR